ncbi:hypothetical protein HB774_26490 (plasmid) [Rhizobium leguminosarum bv. viciae]|nr:hypothetical protein HB774_26490 [Rhizobium leguminosarum bv. viciae]
MFADSTVFMVGAGASVEEKSTVSAEAWIIIAYISILTRRPARYYIH